MNRMLSIGSFFIAVTTAFSALAMSDLQKANELFQKRSHQEHIHAAKAIYQSIIKDKQAALADRKEALVRYARLSIFEGAVARDLFNMDDKKASVIFKTCIEMTDYLSPKKIKQDTAEYTYWRATCIGLRLANINPVKAAFHLGDVKEIQELIKIGQQKFPQYDGYGFDRMEAGLLYKSESLSILKLYNPQKALELINKVINNGTDIYMTYVLKAEILHRLKMTQQAIETLDVGIAELNARFTNNSIPQDVIYENMIFMNNMNTLRNQF